MRLKKINKAPDSIMRKKCIIASALALGGAAVLGMTTFIINEESVSAAIVKVSDSSKKIEDNEIDFKIPIDIGTDEILAKGYDGTAKYFISTEGTLYLFDGELSVKDTQNIGKKYNSKIKKIDGSIGGQLLFPKDSSYLFADNFTNVENIHMWWGEILDTVNVSFMFANMESLKTIDFVGNSLSYTSSAINMRGMFKNDSKLEYIHFDGLITDNATDVSEMFSGVSSLKSLEISNFDMTNVKNSSKMFEGTNFEEVSLGTKNKFTINNILPADDKKIWLSIGKGTTAHPEGKLSFLPNDTSGNSVSKYYDGLGRIGYHRFVLKDMEKPGVLKIDTSIGNRTVIVSGKPDSYVNVKLPVFGKYVPEQSEISAYIRPDGTVTLLTDSKISYNYDSSIIEEGSKPTNPNPTTPVKPVNPSKPSSSGNGASTHSKNKVIKTNVKISTNLGEIEVSVSGKANEKKSVEVPYREGYTADKKKVTVLIKSDGTATTAESVKYTKNNIQIVRNNALLTTFSDKNNVILYHINGDKLTRSNRLLAPNTDWFSDQQVTIDDVTYLRVATNEWIKATNVYMYESSARVVRTKGLTALVDTHGKQVKNRALHGETSWFTDRIVMINGKKYYRVATNELVSANDVY